MQFWHCYKYLLVKAAKNKDGAALLELAISLPFLLMLFLGAVDFTNMIIVQQKMERVAFTIADLTSQYSQDTGIGSYLDSLATQVASDLMRPYKFHRDSYRMYVAAWGRLRPPSLSTGGYWRYYTENNPGCFDNNGGPTIIQSPGYGFGTALIPPPLSSSTEYSDDEGREIHRIRDGERIVGAWLWYRYDPLLPGLARAVRAAGGPSLAGTVFTSGIEFRKQSFMRARAHSRISPALSRC